MAKLCLALCHPETYFIKLLSKDLKKNLKRHPEISSIRLLLRDLKKNMERHIELDEIS
jgi:hypothetical protein